MRKKNKLPAERHSVDFELEYGKATIEVHKDSFSEKDNVLIIDDLIATGGTAEAAAKLIEIANSKVSGFIFVIKTYKQNSYVNFEGSFLNLISPYDHFIGHMVSLTILTYLLIFIFNAWLKNR